MNATAIRADHLSKAYRIVQRQGHTRYKTLREDLLALPGRMISLFLRGGSSRARNSSTFWALDDISFEVSQGEVLGIIGRNGAGKSTLLKVLSRITEPTKGQAEIYGRVGSLLEVGTGFHPELTGRENIFLNGAILGMQRAEIRRQFDAIVAFAEVEQFIDMPVKQYSSGMYMRLAFAVAAHLEPEILLVDEVLAVGDASFQQKCLGKMGEVAKDGRTVLFVSHNLGAIRSLCSRAILMNRGQMILNTDTESAITRYLTENTEYQGSWKRSEAIPDAPGIYFEEVKIVDIAGNTTGHVRASDNFYLCISMYVTKELSNSQVAVRVTNQEGIPIFTTANTDTEGRYHPIEQGYHRFEIVIPSNFLRPGIYSMIVASMIPGVTRFDIIEDSLSFIVEDTGSHATALRDGRQGVVTPLLEWKESVVDAH